MKITEKLRPFSHTPGAKCILPGTCLIVEAFPTRLRVGAEVFKLSLTGPVREFTLQQDLERHCVYVFGRAKEGPYSIRIAATDSGVLVEPEKGTLSPLSFSAEFPFVPNTPFERLSLGNHKTQDWDLIQKRNDLKELLPLLFCLGQKIPRIPPQPLTGTARLLDWPNEEAILSFFKAAFTPLLIPRLTDEHHQGLVPDEPAIGNPFFLLQEGAKRTRALFFVQNERRLSFLPHLPVSLDAGRLIGLRVPGVGTIDIEWSKKVLRRVEISADTSGEVILEMQRGLKTFRCGKRRKKEDPLLLEKGKMYSLDRFE
jgi:hypothetical protein